MSTKIWENDLIGVLENMSSEDIPYRDSIFINKQNSLQFVVRIISQPPESFPNVKTVTSFYSDLEQWGFEDDYQEPDHIRKERLREWLDDRLLVFKVERRIKYNHEEVYNTKDVRVLSKLPSFNQELRLIPVPIFNKESHSMDLDDFVYRLANKKFVGRIEDISHETNDTPSLVLWRSETEEEEQYLVFGEFEKHQYAYGGFCFELREELKEIEFKQEWMDECYFCNDVEDLVYVPLSVYQDMTKEMENVLPIPSSKLIEQNNKEDSMLLTNSNKEEINHLLGSEKEIASTIDEVKLEIVTNKTTLINDSEREFLDLFYENTQDSGLSYKLEDLINFHTSMKSSSLVILSGMSGTGKSKLVDLYSSSLGLKGEQHTVIPVSPSWTSDSDLIGYADTMHMVYRPGDSGLINALKRAESQQDKLFVICFDEMNLARVEHYFSQFLSILEMEPGKRVLRLYNDDLENRLYNSAQYPPTISIQDNVLFVGTVNVDESTYHFSDKVLDRANVLTLEVMPFNQLKTLPEKKKNIAGRKEEIDFDTYKSFKNENRTVTLLNEELDLLWEVHQALQQVNRQIGVGPRIVKQIDQYLANLPLQEYVSRETGMDIQILQRILTKVRGSEEQLRGLLGVYTKEGELIDSKLITILQKYSNISTFLQSKKAIEQKAKELKLHGYTF
ncbi:hypothetical protein HNQ94_000027 [Salirhabdus euzebyi]|uniref:ATPase dynein-related AAA domain-containing protein n=1 Tax=Salirhabdus euzebyi TaxID=394506 RepID=A0A841PWD2_9BACI|nr:AAA family ATPase [Salirhabdus euzebyi]MBB6451606.1 hypothetical protein [Salirhabdus euzebyi]